MRPEPVLAEKGETRPRKDRRRILIVKLSSIGDVVFSLPALEVLRRERPDDHIAWVVEDRAAGILENHPLIDEVIVMPRREWRRLRREQGRFAALKAMMRFARELRARRFDLSFDFQGNLKSGLVAFASRARRRYGLGREDCREPNGFFQHRRGESLGPAAHRVDRDLALLNCASIEGRYETLTLPSSEEKVRDVRRWLDEQIPAPGSPLVIFVPGTSNWLATKRWPAERWAKLAEELTAARSARVLILWGPGEETLVEEIRSHCASELMVPEQALSFPAAAWLFARAEAVIGTDTGPSHLAATTGAPTLILFGPYDPRPLHPYRHPERGLYAAVPCSPCRYRDCPRPVCMTEIRVPDVLEAGCALLDGKTESFFVGAPNRTVKVGR